MDLLEPLFATSSIHKILVPYLNGPEHVALLHTSAAIRKQLKASPYTWHGIDASRTSHADLKLMIRHATRVGQRVKWISLDWNSVETMEKGLKLKTFARFPNLTSLSPVGIGGPHFITDKYLGTYAGRNQVESVRQTLINSVQRGRLDAPEFVAFMGGPSFEYGTFSEIAVETASILNEIGIDTDIPVCGEMFCLDRDVALCEKEPCVCGGCGGRTKACVGCLQVGTCSACHVYGCFRCISELPCQTNGCDECGRMCEACTIKHGRKCERCGKTLCTEHAFTDLSSVATAQDKATCKTCTKSPEKDAKASSSVPGPVLLM